MLGTNTNSHNFGLIPNRETERSVYNFKHTHKLTFDASYLIPIYCEEVLPGDHFYGSMHGISRLITPITPFMDDLYLETFFFYVPNRLVWDNFRKFMGEQVNPGDSISYVLPTLNCTAGGYPVNSIFDYFGLPTVGQVAGSNQVSHQTLPLRMYNLIYNEWFRDQNLINSVTVRKTDSGDAVSDFTLLKRGKRHDYLTSCLPFPQKGTAVSLPLGTSAPVYGTGKALGLTNSSISAGLGFNNATYNAFAPSQASFAANVSTTSPTVTATNGIWGVVTSGTSGLYADLSTATAATINQIRTAFQIQRLLEADARGGTRYTEIVRSHFNVISPDGRLQRPEYIGGGSTPIVINSIPQTSSTDATTPQGNLAATGTMITQGGHNFKFASTEHGYIIGLANIRAELSYQQGLRRHWSRSTRYDFAWPAFTHLGEQSVLNKEIYCDGSANDNNVFGYQERYGEYRFAQSQVSGYLRSTASGTMDIWHLAQKFTSLPTLNQTFIEDNPPLDRVVAVSGANGKHFVSDFLFNVRVARPLPAYGVPGLIDHF